MTTQLGESRRGVTREDIAEIHEQIARMKSIELVNAASYEDRLKARRQMEHHLDAAVNYRAIEKLGNQIGNRT